METILEDYDNKVIAAYTMDLLCENQQGTNGNKKMGVAKHLLRKIEIQVQGSHENLTQKIDIKRSKIPILKKKVPQTKSSPAVPETGHTYQGKVKPKTTTEAQQNVFEELCTVRNISQGCGTMIKTRPSSSSTPVDQKVSKGKPCLKKEAPVSLVFTPSLHRASTPDLDKMLARSRQGTHSSNVFQRLYSQRKQYSPRDSQPVMKLARSTSSLRIIGRGISVSQRAGCDEDYANRCISRGSLNRKN